MKMFRYELFNVIQINTISSEKYCLDVLIGAFPFFLPLILMILLIITAYSKSIIHFYLQTKDLPNWISIYIY